VAIGVFLCLASFTAAVFQEVVRFQAFGAEFPLYWVYDHGISLATVIGTYASLNQTWYRPTATTLIAWIGSRFFTWHDLVGWKLFFLLSLALTAWVLYWFVNTVVPGARLAALLAAFYYLAHPAQDTLPLQMLPWDSLYVMFGLLSAGFFWRALQTEGRTSWTQTAISLGMFIAALTCKELAVVILGFLAAEAAISLAGRFRARAISRELLRLIPFGAVLGLYLAVRLPSLRSLSTSGGTYRVSADWITILNNLRMLPLMSMRIFYLAGYHLAWKSYFETTLSNLVGAAILFITVAGWYFLLRKRPGFRPAGLLFLLWTAVFQLLPIYSGGQIWHVTMPLCGYGALFGLAAMGLADAIPQISLRYGALVTLSAGLLVAGRASLNDELYHGLFTTPSLLTKDLLAHPPIPPEKLGAHPTIYMEDRMNFGGWCYGCYGHLMRYIYQRTDIAEQVVRPDQLPASVNDALLKNPETYYVVYDSGFRWHDATAQMLGALQVTPAYMDLNFTEPVKLKVTQRGLATGEVSWVVTPALGSVDADGYFNPAPAITTRTEGELAVAPEIASVAPGATLTFRSGISERVKVRLQAISTSDTRRTGEAVVEMKLAGSEPVHWSVEPPDGGAITDQGTYTAPADSVARTVMVRATSKAEKTRTATALVTLGAPWQAIDIGRVTEPGDYQLRGDVLRLRGSGDIFLNSDAFRFVYQVLEGDGSITAQISTPAVTAFTKAGLMIRERLAEGARHAFTAVFSGKSCIVEARAEPEAATSVEFGPAAPKWLRLVRKGDTFTGMQSKDGHTWSAIGSPTKVRMESRVFVGLAVSSGSRGSIDAQFTAVRVTSDAPPER
jgi:hypothetical protein